MSCDFENIGVGLGNPGRASGVQMGAGLAETAARVSRETAEADSGGASGASGRGSETAGVCAAHVHELENDQRVHRSHSLPGSSSFPTNSTHEQVVMLMVKSRDLRVHTDRFSACVTVLHLPPCAPSYLVVHMRLSQD